MIINPYRFGFNPLSLSPAIWLSDTGSDAGTWPDLSTNGRHATQATENQQPAIVSGARNGRQVRRFDGSNDVLAFATPYGGYGVEYVWLVIKTTTYKTTTRLVTNASLNGLVSGTSGEYYYPKAMFSATKINGASVTIPTYPTTDIKRFEDFTIFEGVLDSSYPIKYLGYSSNSLNGEMAELYVLPTTPADAVKTIVRNWLAAKWGITLA